MSAAVLLELLVAVLALAYAPAVARQFWRTARLARALGRGNGVLGALLAPPVAWMLVQAGWTVPPEPRAP